jgi:Ner family transcriptional regulator
MATIDVPEKPGLRWEWIKYQLRVRGYSFAALGREYGVNRDNFVNVNLRHAPKYQKIIADKLLMMPEEIWPERYGYDGRPIKHSPRYPRNDSTATGTQQRQSRKRG